jgi:DNA-binding GntR family transcriptional regulator
MSDATQTGTGATLATFDAGQAGGRPDSLALWVYNTLRQAIIDGRMAAGTKPTEAALAKELGVSKTPVREALLRLKAIGLIESEGPMAGRIVSPSADRIRDAYEVREALERTSAHLAAERGDRAVLMAARREAERTVVAADRRDNAGYREADEAFHRTLAEAGGNHQLARMIDDTNALITTLRQRDLPGLDASPLCAEQHMKITTAVLARHADEAAALMSEHVRHVSSEILTHFADSH